MNPRDTDGDPRGALSILHLTEGARFAGIEAHLTHLLPAQARAGDSVLLATFAIGPLSETMRLFGIEPELVERAWRYDPQAARRVREIVRARGIEVLHTHGYLADVVGAAALCGLRERRPAHVATIHGLPEPFRGLARLKMAANLRLDARVLARRADRVVTVTGGVRDFWLARGVPPGKIVVLPSAVSPVGRDPEVRQAVREELAVAEADLLVGFVARLEPVKRAHLLAPLAAALAARRVPFAFVVCGDGPERPRLESTIRASGAADRFRLLGHRTDVERIVQGMDILVIVSASEGVPVSLLEAMSAGAVPVAFRVGGLHEAIDDGVDGLLVAGDDPTALAAVIDDLHRDRERLARLSAAAMEKVRVRFSPDGLASRLRALYLDALAEQNRAR